jgi:hypothetical protein
VLFGNKIKNIKLTMNTRKMTTGSLLRRLSASAAALVISLCAAVSASAQSTNYPATILSNNPVAYYQLQELPGAAQAIDSTTNGLNANYVYDASNSTPELGFPGIDTNSIAFLGNVADGYGSIQIPFNPLLAPVAANGSNGAPFSIECWAEAYSANDGGAYLSLVGMHGTYGGAPYGNASGWLMGQTPGPGSQWLFVVRNGAFFQGTVVTPLKWTHLVGTFDGTNAFFYIDGKLALSQVVGTTSYLPDNGSDGAIGAVPNAGFPPYGPWLGGVDQVAFYTNALTAAQVSNDFVVGTNSFSVRPFPPVILTQPASETNFSGTAVTFSVVAIGSSPLDFQWTRQGVGAIPGATNSTYTFVSQFTNDNGATFSVAISNSVGHADSESATLTVLTNIVVTGPPFSITRNVGSHAAFRIAASGALPISYQWSVSTNGTTFATLPGQTADTLWLTNVQLTSSGNEYAVVATNPFTSYSNSATLTVQPRTENVTLTGYGAIVAADNPVAFYRLNEPTNSTTAIDAVGSFDGAYSSLLGNIVFGIASGVPNDTNTAVDLQDNQTTAGGQGGQVDIPYYLELNPFGSWSMEAWIRPDSVDGQFRVPISSMENTNSGNEDYGWLIYEYGSIPSFWTAVLYNGGSGGAFQTDFGPTFPVAGTWSYLVITDDGTNIIFYVNAAVGSATSVAAAGYAPQGVNGDPSVAGKDEVIGQRSDNAFFGGNAGTEDVAFYNYALSPSQVQSHYLNKASLSISEVAGKITLTWPVGTLLGTSDLTKPFLPVAGTTSPYTVPTGSGQFFYEVVVH